MSETENIVQTIKSTIQDLVAPDVRELKVRLESVDKRIDGVDKRLDGVDKRLDGIDKRLDSFQQQMTAFHRSLQEENAAHFRALLAAIQQGRAEASQSKAETELLVYKQVSALADRVTAIEVKLQQAESRAA